jgi:hypothetical protein
MNDSSSAAARRETSEETCPPIVGVHDVGTTHGLPEAGGAGEIELAADRDDSGRDSSALEVGCDRRGCADDVDIHAFAGDGGDEIA